MFPVGNRTIAQSIHFPYELKARTSDALILAADYPEFSFLFPEMAGSLKLGIMISNESKWISTLKVKKVDYTSKSISYQIEDTFLQGGCVSFDIISLQDTDGIVIEVSAANLPADTYLFWAYGGASGKILDKRQNDFQLSPNYCKYNVFSVEHTAFTLYYGKSMNLKTINAVMPINSEIRLSDAHKQENPYLFFESGKRTDSPALCGRLPLKDGEKEYFCIYKQNKQADFNHYMLPALFLKEKG